MKRQGNKAPSQRQLRVGEELRHALAWALERGELRDPGLHGAAVTVTEVSVSPDLRNATAFVVPLGGGDGAAILDALVRARSFLRRKIAGSLRLKYTPDLNFELDTAFDRAEQIDILLKGPSVARDLGRSKNETEDEDGGS